MKKVFITGGCGFIGSHIAEYFVKRKFKVIVYDKYNANNDYGNLNNSKYLKKIKIVLGDIRDFNHLEKNMRGCNKVIHLAALIGIPYSYHAPKSYIHTNVEGTYNVLESCLRNKIKKTIITSTSEVYGTGKKFPMDENHTINCQSPYSASKSAADNISMSYYYSFKLPMTILRPFNVYGPRQSNRAIIPSIIQQSMYSDKILVGNLHTERDFTFIDDLCNAYLKVINNPSNNGEVIHTGSGKCISINKILQMILKLEKKKMKIEISGQRLRPETSEVYKLKSSIKKIKKLYGWQPSVSFIEGLKKTILWHKKNLSNNPSDYAI